jgi:hypothetical protein
MGPGRKSEIGRITASRKMGIVNKLRQHHWGSGAFDSAAW